MITGGALQCRPGRDQFFLPMSLSSALPGDRDTSQKLNLLWKAQRGFVSTFGEPESDDVTFASFAPGRVNLIGEHTDYNNGFVMPCALELGTVVFGTGRIIPSTHINASKIRVSSDLKDCAPVSFMANAALRPGEEQWANYVKGVFSQYLSDLPSGLAFSMDLYLSGSLPLGGGLSSSASLTVSVATFIEAVLKANAIQVSEDPREKARKCRRAEHVFLNTPCGIMDQFVSALAPHGHAILIDCQSETFKPYPLEDPSISIVIADSRVKHSLGERGNQYPIRVAQCQSAADALGVSSLREANISMLDHLMKSNVDRLILSRARHVITENERCIKFANALQENNYVQAGEAMFESHRSLSKDYEVSIPELDVLVELAKEVEGVFGSRLTGAGFGGCTVTLARTDAVSKLKAHLIEGYSQKFGIECQVFATHAGEGAHVLLRPSIESI